MADTTNDRVEEIFTAALESSGAEREALIEEMSDGDAGVSGRVRLLLRAHESAGGGFLQARDAGAGEGGADDPRIGRRIGSYVIRRVIARGGMGVVYEAEQEHPRRVVAFKVIRTSVATDLIQRRFELESEVLGRLQHPGIAQILEAGTADTGDGIQPYFAMEFIEGVPLMRYVETSALSLEERLELLAKICDAMEHAHQKGVIHRDLKPANILVTADGQPKVLDFGVACVTDRDHQASTVHTDAGQLVGTMPYMSPEQASGDTDELDIRSDIYALGVLGYRLLGGRLPYDLDRKLVHQIVQTICVEEPPRLGTIDRLLRGDVETIVAKALEKDKTRRYQHANDLAEDIRRSLRHEPIVARPPSIGYQLSKFARRHRTLVGSAAVVGVLLTGTVVATSILVVRELQARAQAAAARDDLAVVVDYQANMFDLDYAEFGRLVVQDLRDRVESGLERADLSEAEITQALAGLSDLGVVNYADFGRDLLDKTILQRAMRTIARDFKDRPLIEAQLRSTVGTAYLALGDPAAAAPQFELVLALREQGLGPDAPETFASMRRLAETYIDTARLEEAEALLMSALDGYRRTLGPEDEATLICMHFLAELNHNRVRYDQAESLFDDTLATMTEVLGPDHPATLSAMHDLVLLYRDQGRFAEAVSLCERTLAGRRRVLGEAHRDTMNTMNSLAKLHLDTDELEEAEELYERTLDVETRVLGADAPETLVTMNNLAAVYRRHGRYEQAQRLFERTLEARRRVLGQAHPFTLATMNNLGLVYRDQGHYDQAELLYVETLQRKRQILDDDHIETLISLVNLGGLYNTMERFDDARALLDEAVRGARRALPSGHWYTGAFLTKYGETLTALAEYEEAEAALLEAHAILLSGRGESHARTVAAVEALVVLYDESQQAEAAATWRARLSPRGG